MREKKQSFIHYNVKETNSNKIKDWEYLVFFAYDALVNNQTRLGSLGKGTQLFPPSIKSVINN